MLWQAIVGETGGKTPLLLSSSLDPHDRTDFGKRRSRAMHSLQDLAIASLEPMLAAIPESDPEKRLLCLWLFSAAIDSKHTRAWARGLSGMVAKTAVGYLFDTQIDEDMRDRIREKAPLVVVRKLRRSQKKAC